MLHAFWNAIAKSDEDGLITFAFIGVVSSVGGGAVLLSTGLPDRGSVYFVLASVGVHLCYQVGLMYSYRWGSFNQTYPIARGVAPLSVAVGAWIIATEQLSGPALAGLIILAAGLISLAFSAGRPSQRDLPPVGAALGTGLMIATYTLIDGFGVRRGGNPLAYGGLLFLLEGLAFPSVAVIRRPLTNLRPARIGRGAVAGVLSLAAYFIVLWAQTLAPLGEVAALRETSVIWAALIGAVVMKERFGVRRIAVAIAVAVGIVLMSL
jgi:drug/metabolite transporter (DMT)-like permease